MTCGLREGVALAERSLELVKAVAGRVGRPGQLGRSIARSAPPAHPADKLGWEGFAQIYLQDWDSSWYGELLAAAELIPVKAFPAGYEIAIL